MVRDGQRTIRIGLDGDTLGRKRTGDESYLASLMRGLGRVDQRNDYVVYVRDAGAVRPTFPELTRFAFRTVRPRSIWLRQPFGFPWALRRKPVDVLHAQYFLPPLCPCPTVLTVHDISFAVHPEFFTLRDRVLLGALVPYALHRADRIITDVEFTRQEFVRVYGLDPARIHVIPLAADPRYRPLDRETCVRTVRERHKLEGDFILYVGTLQPRKNVDTLVRAYARFRRDTGLRHKLLVIGKLKYRFGPVFEAIEQSGFADDIVFTGFVADEDLPAYYNAASLFVFPSRYEGFGLPVLEAMACGTPVVTTTSSSLPEVAGDAGILVDPSDDKAMSEAMARVFGEVNLAEQMRQAGLRQAALFSWDRTAAATLAVYEDLLRDG